MCRTFYEGIVPFKPTAYGLHNILKRNDLLIARAKVSCLLALNCPCPGTALSPLTALELPFSPSLPWNSGHHITIGAWLWAIGAQRLTIPSEWQMSVLGIPVDCGPLQITDACAWSKAFNVVLV